MKLLKEKSTAQSTLPPKRTRGEGSRRFDAEVTFQFIQDGKRQTDTVAVTVPASNMLGALGRAGRLAMPKLRENYPKGKIKLRSITADIAGIRET